MYYGMWKKGSCTRGTHAASTGAGDDRAGDKAEGKDEGPGEDGLHDPSVAGRVNSDEGYPPAKNEGGQERRRSQHGRGCGGGMTRCHRGYCRRQVPRRRNGEGSAFVVDRSRGVGWFLLEDCRCGWSSGGHFLVWVCFLL